jgi:hypothetical protein
MVDCQVKKEDGDNYKSKNIFYIDLGYINYSTNSHMTTPTEELAIQNIDHLDYPNYNSSKDCISEFYSNESGHFGELLNLASNPKVDSLYDNGIWNFEDYFTI